MTCPLPYISSRSEPFYHIPFHHITCHSISQPIPDLVPSRFAPSRLFSFRVIPPILSYLLLRFVSFRSRSRSVQSGPVCLDAIQLDQIRSDQICYDPIQSDPNRTDPNRSSPFRFVLFRFILSHSSCSPRVMLRSVPVRGRVRFFPYHHDVLSTGHAHKSPCLDSDHAFCSCHRQKWRQQPRQTNGSLYYVTGRPPSDGDFGSMVDVPIEGGEGSLCGQSVQYGSERKEWGRVWIVGTINMTFRSITTFAEWSPQRSSWLNNELNALLKLERAKLR